MNRIFTLAAAAFGALCLLGVLLLTTSFEVNDLMIERLADRPSDLPAQPPDWLLDSFLADWLSDRLIN